MLGGFDCLGYVHSGATRAKGGTKTVTQSIGAPSPSMTQDGPATNSSPALDFLSNSTEQMDWSAASIDLPSGLFSPPENVGVWQDDQYNLVTAAPLYEPKSIPRNPQLDPFDLENMKQLIVTQCTSNCQ